MGRRGARGDRGDRGARAARGARGARGAPTGSWGPWGPPGTIYSVIERDWTPAPHKHGTGVEGTWPVHSLLLLSWACGSALVVSVSA